MNAKRNFGWLLALAAAAGLAAACTKKEPPAPVATQETAPPTPVGGGKIPVTTASAEAKAEYLAGRDLVDKLQITDSYAHFQKAVELDPNFALAELALANSSPTAKEFFEHMRRAVNLSEKASNGEKLLILANEAGANALPRTQKEHLDALVAAYPDDERAQFALGGYYFGQADFPRAIECYKKATEINPNYSSAFNLLGYSLRQNGDYADAEKAFQKYVALIPKDPNPYDSYAELLLKMGRFEDSIAQYRKALEIDPNFINAHMGIAMDLLYMGKSAEAAAELETMVKKARTDGERRTAFFASTVANMDGGKTAKALADVDKQYALGDKTKDTAAMAGDLVLRGNILLELGKPAEADKQFQLASKMIEESNLSPQIKQNNQRFVHFNNARVAMAKKDLAKAEAETEEFRKMAEAVNNPNQVKLAHELAGSIALAEKDYDKAIAELQQANNQNPYNAYRLCKAYQGKGDAEKASAACKQAADFNSLPNLNYSFIRTKAKAGAGEKKG
jgi:tetratricopeptide (TPR) repeat protein